MSLMDTIRSRRSIKRFTDEEVTRHQIEQLLEAVCQAPNHRMTEPWRFYVLGPEARAGYGRALGRRKAKRVEDAVAAKAVVDKVEASHRALPTMLVIAIVKDENPEIHEEDYAAVYMGVQNLSLLAHEMGLGTHLKTGAVMDDPDARAAVGLPDSERIVAVLEVGVPGSVPDAKPRKGAAGFTTWLP